MGRKPIFKKADGMIAYIRESFVMLVPIIMIGAFALVLQSLPIPGYTELIQNAAGGVFYDLTSMLKQATTDALAVYTAVSVSLCYSNRVKNAGGYYFGPVFSSVCVFLILCGVFAEGGSTTVLGVNGIFTAIVSGVGASALFHWFKERIHFHRLFFTEGADDIFHNAIQHFFPMFFTILSFAAANLLLTVLCGENSFQAVYISLLARMFQWLGNNLLSLSLYVLAVHVLWMFGIHGSNVLETVSGGTFSEAVDINTALIEQGLPPTELFNRDLINVFVLMGGCGSTICLLLAILFFSRKRSTRNLAVVAAFPGIFNVNELLVFGLPIAFNPIYAIPFFLTPLVFLLTSTAAMQLGLVPIAAYHVEWTTPILLSGYFATRSAAGALLQLLNLVIGIFIYRPFVRIMDTRTEQNGKERLQELVEILQESERSRVPVHLLSMKNELGLAAKTLAQDLESQFEKELPTLYYQPQFDEQKQCIGAEALLRWKHPRYGMIYPPLVIKLAEETDRLLPFEEAVFRSVIRDMDELMDALGEEIKISINVTGTTIQQEAYENFLREMADTYPQYVPRILLEITEQAALTIDQRLIERLTRIRNMGYRLGIDDFSMGSTSIKYLQTNVFSLIKLDGGLSRDIMDNSRSKGIVASVADLSKQFGIQMLAEYVETEEQRAMLEELGCGCYQGYLYSSAVELKQLAKFKKKQES